jgi:hypothetical protein
MRCCFDCEFIDRGRHGIGLLTIGIVREDGATFYAEIDDEPTDDASPWVREHVLAIMGREGVMVAPRAEVAAAVVRFAGPNPQWWAYYDQYDWVALSGLYGTLIDRPSTWPMRCRDVAELAKLAGMGTGDGWVPIEEALAAQRGLVLPTDAHHALAGAWWCEALLEVSALRLLDLYGLEVLA